MDRFIILLTAVNYACCSVYEARIASTRNITVIVNQRAVLSCTSSTSDPVLARWYHRKSHASKYSEIAYRGKVFSNFTTLYELEDNNLIVKSVFVNVTGVYRCTEKNGEGRRHIINLNLQEKAEVPNPNSMNDAVAQQGESVRLYCGKGEPPFDWWHQPSTADAIQQVCSDGKVDAKYEGRFFIDPSNPRILGFNDSRRSDSGFFSCIEKNGLGPSTFTVHLHVNAGVGLVNMYHVSIWLSIGVPIICMGIAFLVYIGIKNHRRKSRPTPTNDVNEAGGVHLMANR